MSTLPGAARVVVIGAGIVGNSLVYHLARLGWRDIVQIEKGPLPNPGGSTGHASNFIFLTDHSREMTKLTLDSVEQYKEMGVFTQSGGFEIARTPERIGLPTWTEVVVNVEPVWPLIVDQLPLVDSCQIRP